MNAKSSLVLFHNPHSRSCMTRALIEELGLEYELCPVDFRDNEQLSPEFVAVNPMGKVPTIRSGGEVVTETVAIYIYLSDLASNPELSPGLDDPQRGPWLRWLVFYAACFEPALIEKIQGREPAPRAQSPYVDFQTVLDTVLARLASGPYLLGERFSTADVLWANALRWVTGFGLVASTPVIDGYMDRVLSRPAQQRASAADHAMATEMGLAA